MHNKRLWILLILVFFIAGAAGSFFLSKQLSPPDAPHPAASPSDPPGEREDTLTLRVFYPKNRTLQMEEKKVPSRTNQLSVAEAVIEEYFRGPSDSSGSTIPGGVKLLGLYRDADMILYIDLSDEFRRNLQGDAHTEYLLLKGLSESLVSNLQDFSDFKILIEGKEHESLGGHFYLGHPLKGLVAGDPRGPGKALQDE